MRVTIIGMVEVCLILEVMGTGEEGMVVIESMYVY
jgi:hypothetical protein